MVKTQCVRRIVAYVSKILKPMIIRKSMGLQHVHFENMLSDLPLVFYFRFFNYGSVQAYPSLENGSLVMRHNSPTPCKGTQNYSSVIYFYCDKTVRVSLNI